MNQRFGLTTHAGWHQANPDGSDVAVVVVDGPGSASFLGDLARSDHPFDAWFRSGIEDVHPVDFSARCRRARPTDPGGRSVIDQTL